MNIDDVLRWLAHADEELTLVGGQAVALWEHLLGLPILTETLDIDFLGDPAQAEALAEALHCAYLVQLAAQDRLPEAIKMANRIFDLAIGDAGKRVYFEQRIDLLNAVPEPELFRTPAFTEENYPRQIERVRQRRERFALFLARRARHESPQP